MVLLDQSLFIDRYSAERNRTMKSTIFAMTLLLGHLVFGQPTPFKGGLLTNQTSILPAELVSCGHIAFQGMNARESFLVGRTCAGEIKIYRAVGDEPFVAVASEAQFGEFKLLSWAQPQFGFDEWLLPTMEVRPDGFYFNLMELLPSGTAFNEGAGGSYRIAGGKLEQLVGPGESINYMHPWLGVRRIAKIEVSSVPFPKNGGGDFYFLRTSSNGVRTDGIFLKKGTEWSLILLFQPGPAQGMTIPYGMGNVISVYGINEALDGTLSFLQAWLSQGDPNIKFEWMSFNPRTQELNLRYRLGAPILGVTPVIQAALMDSDTRQKYWRIGSGPFSNKVDYVASAPNPGFNPWKWVIPTSMPISLLGISEHFASYLTANSPTDYLGSGLAVWDGRNFQPLVSNGDTLPGNVKTSKVSNNFTNRNSFVPVSGCTMRFATYKTDNKVESFWKFQKPCIADVAIDKSQVVLYGKNLTLSGATPTVLVDGVAVSGATISTDRITVPISNLTSGERKVKVVVTPGVETSEVSVVVPSTTPDPTITDVVTATFERRPIAAGGLFTIRGRNLSPVTSDPTNLVVPGITVPVVKPGEVPRLPRILGGTRVLVNGKEIPLGFVSCFVDGACQINAQMPLETIGPTAKVVVQRFADVNGQGTFATSKEVLVPVASISPVVFKMEDELPILQVADRAYELVSKVSPARAGETLVGYASGFGPTSPTIEDGMPADQVLALVSAEVKAWLKFQQNGTEKFERVSIAGFLSPQFVGVTQFNLGALPHVEADNNAVYLVIQVGDEYVPDLKIPYAP